MSDTEKERRVLHPLHKPLASPEDQINEARLAGYEIDMRATWDAVANGDYRIIMTRETDE